MTKEGTRVEHMLQQVLNLLPFSAHLLVWKVLNFYLGDLKQYFH